MPSETDLVNEALALIGADEIVGLDDGTINANRVKRLWPSTRQAILRLSHWPFASARAQLPQDALAPLFGFTFSYTLPADQLKLVEFNGISLTGTSRSPVFKIEGPKLLSDDSVVKIIYIRDVVDITLWDALAFQVGVVWLASKLASAITKDDRKASTLLQQAVGVLLPLAAGVSGQEMDITPYVVDDLTRER